jgi:hypothetical protein
LTNPNDHFLVKVGEPPLIDPFSLSHNLYMMLGISGSSIGEPNPTIPNVMGGHTRKGKACKCILVQPFVEYDIPNMLGETT